MHFHAKKIDAVVGEALARAGVQDPARALTAIAVTNRPGLKGPLMVGTDYAKYLCLKHNLPMLPVHHMAAHALTARLGRPDLAFPFLVLLVSGGHCLLALARDIDSFVLLGETVDDSPGEALDK
jgi:N6-L-threonylcarbamoyladenine synthase